MATLFRDIGIGLWIGLTIYLFNHQAPGALNLLTFAIVVGTAALYVIGAYAARRARRHAEQTGEQGLPQGKK